ncbi:hypothetical protein [Hyphomicrobium sp. 802]|uniref:hypothetical protein n=1 Tax=Hyphomicrobium sp. 802 TaxID=1112272 RepID=UPI00045E9281|nr:hypothetical protein [Hyphomicrobium sp. 802]
MTPEQAAEIILRIFVARNVGTNEIQPFGAINFDFVRHEGRTPEQFEDGWQFGVLEGWWTQSGSMAILTARGANAVRRLT